MAKARRKMSAKQIRHFGTKRQKAALRAKRSAPKHRSRTRPNPPRKRRAVATPKRKRRSVAKKSAAKRRRNPTPMIISWAAGNPAKRSKTVARSRRKSRKRATAKRANAGRRRTMRVVRHHRRRNPGALGSPMNWIQGGAGVVAGVVGARAIPQLVLGTSNTGTTGYVANAVVAIGLGWLTHMVFPRNQILATSVIAGGFAGLISRIIADQTPFGAQLSLSGGLGDWGLGLYQKSNYPYPPHLMNGRGPNSSMFSWGDGSQGAMPATLAAPADSTGAC